MTCFLSLCVGEGRKSKECRCHPLFYSVNIIHFFAGEILFHCIETWSSRLNFKSFLWLNRWQRWWWLKRKSDKSTKKWKKSHTDLWCVWLNTNLLAFYWHCCWERNQINLSFCVRSNMHVIVFEHTHFAHFCHRKHQIFFISFYFMLMYLHSYLYICLCLCLCSCLCVPPQMLTVVVALGFAMLWYRSIISSNFWWIQHKRTHDQQMNHALNRFENRFGI